MGKVTSKREATRLAALTDAELHRDRAALLGLGRLSRPEARRLDDMRREGNRRAMLRVYGREEIPALDPDSAALRRSYVRQRGEGAGAVITAMPEEVAW